MSLQPKGNGSTWASDGDGDIWTKDGYILLGSDIKLIRRTYEHQLPLDYAQDKGLRVW